MFKICCIALLATFTFGCAIESDELAQPLPELEHLDLSGLDIQIDMDLDYYEPVGYANPKELIEFFGEVSQAIMSVEESNFTTILKVQKHQTQVVVNDDSTLNVMQKADWTRVGQGTCKTEECIAERVAEAYGNVPDLGVGECFEVRIRGVLLGAHVEYRVSDCE